MNTINTTDNCKYCIEKQTLKLTEYAVHEYCILHAETVAWRQLINKYTDLPNVVHYLFNLFTKYKAMCYQIWNCLFGIMLGIIMQIQQNEHSIGIAISNFTIFQTCYCQIKEILRLLMYYCQKYQLLNNSNCYLEH